MRTNISVTTTVDNGNGTIVGSLSWAISAANAIAQNGFQIPTVSSGDVRYADGNDRIKFRETPQSPEVEYDLITVPDFVTPIKIYFDKLAFFNAGATHISVNTSLPELKAPVEIYGIVGSTIPGNPSTPVTLDGNYLNPPAISAGIRYDGAAYTASNLKFRVQDVTLANFDTSPLQIRTLGNGDKVEIDHVEIRNSGFTTGDAGVAILDTPSGTGYFSITNSTIKDNGGAGILVTDTVGSGTPLENTANVIANNSILHNGLYSSSQDYLRSGILLEKFRRISLSNNVVETPSHLWGLYIAGYVVDVTISSNSFSAIDASPIALQGFNSPENNRFKITSNNFSISKTTTSSQIIPPIDYFTDGAVTLFNPNGPFDPSGAPGANPADGTVGWAPNPIALLPDEISLSSSGGWEIPFRSRFGTSTNNGAVYDAGGTYVVELFKLAGTTWTRVDARTFNIPSGVFKGSLFAASSDLAEGDKIAAVATAQTGANANRSTEFSFPSQTTYYEVKNPVPKLVSASIRGSAWTSSVSSLPLYNGVTNVVSGFTRPIFQTGFNSTSGVDIVDITFSKPMMFSQSPVIARSIQNGVENSVTAPLLQANPDGNPLTNDYRFKFANRLESNKYVLEIRDDFLTDGGSQKFDGDTVVNYGQFDNYADDIITQVGDGAAGGSAWFNFSVLYGDSNGDGLVTNADANSDINANGNSSDDGGVLATIQSSGVTSLPMLSKDGDYFDNDHVDTGDLNLWQMAFGGHLNDPNPAIAGKYDARADFDKDGWVDGLDFLFWQRQYDKRSAWYVEPPVVAASPVVGALPKVSNVIISGSTSVHVPYSFDTVDGSGAQLKTVPVGAADTISMTFTEDVDVNSTDLIVVGLTTANVPRLASFAYDAANFKATWRFEGWALGDQYVLSLSDRIKDSDENTLDGEWTNPATTITTNSAVSTFPSGDGVRGGRFNFVVTLLPGDANLDNVVDASDFSIFSANFNLVNRLFTQGDFNGNGKTTFNGDYYLLGANYNKNLQLLHILADFNADNDVDDADLSVIVAHSGMTNASWSDGDLNGDGTVTKDDLDLAYAQWGLDIEAVA